MKDATNITTSTMTTRMTSISVSGTNFQVPHDFFIYLQNLLPWSVVPKKKKNDDNDDDDEGSSTSTGGDGGLLSLEADPDSFRWLLYYIKNDSLPEALFDDNNNQQQQQQYNLQSLYTLAVVLGIHKLVHYLRERRTTTSSSTSTTTTTTTTTGLYNNNDNNKTTDDSATNINNNNNNNHNNKKKKKLKDNKRHGVSWYDCKIQGKRKLDALFRGRGHSNNIMSSPFSFSSPSSYKVLMYPSDCRIVNNDP